jgi:hypothetical protein
MVKLSIPACGPMRNVRINEYENDFIFNVCGHSFSCPGFFAEVVSPAVSRCRSHDSTFEVFNVEMQGSDKIFQAALDLCSGSEVGVDDSTRRGLLVLFQTLENFDFVESVAGDCWKRELTKDNVCDVFQLKSELNLNVSREVSYLASHFGEIGETDLRRLSVSELSQVLSDKSLRLRTEDSLYDFISSFSEGDFAQLLEFVRFEFLSNRKFCEFVKCTENHFDILNSPTWIQVTRRLLMKIQMSSVRHSEIAFTNTVPPPNCPLDQLPLLHGIVASLRYEHGGSWKDFIEVSSSSIHAPAERYHRDYAADISPANGFASLDNDVNPWLEYRFPYATVRPTHYAIRSWFANCLHNQWPRKWKIEGWTDSGELLEVDTSIDSDADVLQDNLVVTFPVRNQKFVDHPQFLRRIRFTQLGLNNRNGKTLIISSLELFGEIRQDS